MELIKHLSDEYILSCLICYQHYSKELYPLILPCGHNVCNICFKRLRNAENESEFGNEDNEDNQENEEINIEIVNNEDGMEIDRGINEEGVIGGIRENVIGISRNEEFERKEMENSLNVCEKQVDYINTYKLNSIVKISSNHFSDNDQSEINSLHSRFNLEKSNTQSITVKEKIRLKCPNCRSKFKILEDEIVINQHVLQYAINYLNQTNNNIKPNKDSYIFCKECKKVDKLPSTSVL